MKKTLIVGAGEAGTILANTIKKELDRRGAEGYLFKTINSSKNDSNKATDIQEENRFLLEDIGGMAKEMEKVAEIMQEQGRKVLTNIFSEVMSGSIDRVLMLSSLGGGTGCGITINIVQMFSKKLKDNGVKLRALLIAPFKNEDMVSKRNTVAAVQVLQDFKIPTRIVSNANYMNSEGRTQHEVHNSINKYIAETEIILQEVESLKTIGINTDIAELDKILYTPGYTFVTRIKLSTKDKDKNQRDIIQKLHNSLDMENNKDFHKYSIMVISAIPEVSSKLNLDEINDEMGVTENSRFKTYIQPEGENYILIAISGAAFPNQIEAIYKEVMKHKEDINSNKKKKLSLNLTNMFDTEEEEENVSGNDMSALFGTKKKEKQKLKIGLEDEWF